MGERGPKSDTPKLAVLETAKKKFPNPQPGMNQAARTVWHRIVKSKPHDFFRPQHYDLLRVFCEASAMHKKAIREINKEGEIITQKNGVMKENPWIGVMDKMAGRMLGAAVKLQIAKSSTTSTHGKDKDKPKPNSKRKGLLFNG